MSASPHLEVRRLGATDYAATLELQRTLVEQRAKAEVGDVLILTEHEPVLTAVSYTHLTLPTIYSV